MLEDSVSVLGASLEISDNSNVLLFEGLAVVPFWLVLSPAYLLCSVGKPWYNIVIPKSYRSLINHSREMKHSHV